MGIIFFFITTFLTFVKNENILTDIPNLGNILGKVQFTRENQMKYYSFQGVRYAEPVKRFQLSEPVRPWKGVYDASEEKPHCIVSNVFSKLKSSEDCLFLNIYTPQIDASAETILPVLFWIHGGCFTEGSTDFATTGPDYFLEEHLVVVHVNYRLNAFGFMSDANLVEENLALKDIILALKYVKENIQYFGGNSENVAVFGQSAGAVLASYMLQSPLVSNKGYFKRAILNSGSSLNGWALQRNPQKMYRSVTDSTICVIQSLGIKEAELKCLEELSKSTLQSAALIAESYEAANQISILNGIPFAPSLESSENETSAITLKAWKAFRNNQFANVEILTGITSEESLFFQSIISFIRPLLGQIDLNHNILVPEDMYANETATTLIAGLLHAYYFQDKTIVLSKIDDYLKYSSDRAFNVPFREFLTLVNKKNPTFCYVFDYSPDKSKNNSSLGGVGHGEELNYLWETGTLQTENDQSKLVRKRMVRLWSNFVKYGHPTPLKDKLLNGFLWPTAWNPWSPKETDVDCVLINENLTVISNPKEREYQMWREFYYNFGNPQDTF